MVLHGRNPRKTSSNLNKEATGLQVRVLPPTIIDINL